MATTNEAKGGGQAEISLSRGEARAATDQAAGKAKRIAPEGAAPAIEKARMFANERLLVVVGAAVLAIVVLGRLASR